MTLHIMCEVVHREFSCLWISICRIWVDISNGATTVSDRMSNTPQIKIVNALLEATHSTTLDEFLAARRAEGLSYERIARDLHALTDGDVSVVGETVRRWINDTEAVA